MQRVSSYHSWYFSLLIMDCLPSHAMYSCHKTFLLVLHLYNCRDSDMLYCFQPVPCDRWHYYNKYYPLLAPSLYPGSLYHKVCTSIYVYTEVMNPVSLPTDLSHHISYIEHRLQVLFLISSCLCHRTHTGNTVRSG